MGSRDHSWQCENCGGWRGGMNDLHCLCEIVSRDTAPASVHPSHLPTVIDTLEDEIARLQSDLLTRSSNFCTLAKQLEEVAGERDRLKAEAERLRAENAEVDTAFMLADGWKKTRDSAIAERDSLRARLAVIEPVFDAAVDWRRTVDFQCPRAPCETFSVELFLQQEIDAATKGDT